MDCIAVIIKSECYIQKGKSHKNNVKKKEPDIKD